MAQQNGRKNFRAQDDEERLTILDELDQSDMTMAEFSAATGVAVSTLSYWRQRFRSTSAGRKVRHSAPLDSPDLIPVKLIKAADVSPTDEWRAEVFKVRVRGGRSVLVPTGFDADELVRLVGALESRC